MPKLQVKGKNEYVTMAKVPTEMAKSESAIVFAAFRSAVEGLLEQVNTPGKSGEMEKHALKQMLLFEALHQDMMEDLKRVALILSVVKAKLNTWGDDVEA
jgi:hypothetical protein